MVQQPSGQAVCPRCGFAAPRPTRPPANPAAGWVPLAPGEVPPGHGMMPYAAPPPPPNPHADDDLPLWVRVLCLVLAVVLVGAQAMAFEMAYAALDDTNPREAEAEQAAFFSLLLGVPAMGLLWFLRPLQAHWPVLLALVAAGAAYGFFVADQLHYDPQVCEEDIFFDDCTDNDSGWSFLMTGAVAFFLFGFLPYAAQRSRSPRIRALDGSRWVRGIGAGVLAGHVVGVWTAATLFLSRLGELSEEAAAARAQDQYYGTPGFVAWACIAAVAVAFTLARRRLRAR